MQIDPEDTAEQKGLLAEWRRTLIHLLRQTAQYGGEVFTPPVTANGITTARREIRHIKARLRALGVPVQDKWIDTRLPKQKINNLRRLMLLPLVSVIVVTIGGSAPIKPSTTVSQMIDTMSIPPTRVALIEPPTTTPLATVYTQPNMLTATSRMPRTAVLTTATTAVLLSTAKAPTTPTATLIPPTATPVPPTHTPILPTATPVPPTHTPVPPTATPVPPTHTPVPPTATPVPPTAQPPIEAPTNTPVTPTAQPPIETPTNTPVPPTGSPVGSWAGSTDQGEPITFYVEPDPFSYAAVNLSVSFQFEPSCPIGKVVFSSLDAAHISGPPGQSFRFLGLKEPQATASLEAGISGTTASGTLTVYDTRSPEERSANNCAFSTTIEWTATKR
jgi:hypothetical protein